MASQRVPGRKGVHLHLAPAGGRPVWKRARQRAVVAGSHGGDHHGLYSVDAVVPQRRVAGERRGQQAVEGGQG